MARCDSFGSCHPSFFHTKFKQLCTILKYNNVFSTLLVGSVTHYNYGVGVFIRGLTDTALHVR